MSRVATGPAIRKARPSSAGSGFPFSSRSVALLPVAFSIAVIPAAQLFGVASVMGEGPFGGAFAPAGLAAVKAAVAAATVRQRASDVADRRKVVGVKAV